MKKGNEEEFKRVQAAEYLGVAPNTLKKFPIPFRQYQHYGHAFYKKADLDKFKDECTYYPQDERHKV